jgi:monoamine oxidase
VSALEYLERQGASAEVRELLRVAFLARLGDGGRNLSALYVVRALRDALEPGHATSWMTIAGGNDLLPQRLAQLLPTAIEYGCAVTRIEHSRSSVTVTFRRDGREERQVADDVICATPFSCLRAVELAPALRPEKRDVIEGLRSTSVTHVFVQMRRRFWTSRSDLGTMGATDLPIGLVRDATFNQAGERGIIDCYSAGEDARALAAMEDADRDAFVLEHLERVLPGSQEHREQIVLKSWDDDEWSRGDYAWFAPGEMMRFSPHLATPEGRVHFAGDQTSPWPTWQEGAIHSGHRAAREVHLRE